MSNPYAGFSPSCTDLSSCTLPIGYAWCRLMSMCSLGAVTAEPVPTTLFCYPYGWHCNCASIRLALQLAADAAVFKVEHDDMEWFYPLLKPYVHYIPVTANATHTDLLDKMDWAERHPNVVRHIAISANQFARRFLSNTARDCYFMQLAQTFHQMMTGHPSLPTEIISPPD